MPITRSRLIALLLFIALCSAIIATVVWKTQSQPASGPNQSLIEEQYYPPAVDSDSIADDDAGVSTAEKLPDSDEPSSENKPLQSNVEAGSEAESAEPAESEESASTLKNTEIVLEDELLKMLSEGFDLTIPSYAMDADRNVPEWVTKGPDMFDSVVLSDPATDNTASNRFCWYAHMNRKDETMSLYDQLGIAPSDVENVEAWVNIAIGTAKEIRRRIMQYFVFFAPEYAKCDLDPWNAIQHEAPETVQHRMQVFIAKLEFLQPFDHLRRVTQAEIVYGKATDGLHHYFRYRDKIEKWQQKYHDIIEEVEQLSFQGCTRVFKIAGNAAEAYEIIIAQLDGVRERVEACTDEQTLVNSANIFLRATGPGSDMMDRLEKPLQIRLKQMNDKCDAIIDRRILAVIQKLYPEEI